MISALKKPRDTRTRLSLLARLREPGNEAAWTEFVATYGPHIHSWCRRFGLQDSDASDVTQEVLARLMRALQSFEYDETRGRFRGWLTRVTNNAIVDYVRFVKRGQGSGDSSVMRSLAAIQAPDAIGDLVRALEAEAERELLSRAEEIVRQRVAPQTWQAYVGTAIEGRKAAEICDAIGMRASEVYVAKSRVIKMLRGEVRKLKQED